MALCVNVIQYNESTPVLGFLKLSVIMLSVVMLNVAMLNVFMQSVVAP
jgi:hypothetical protein